MKRSTVFLAAGIAAFLLLAAATFRLGSQVGDLKNQVDSLQSSLTQMESSLRRDISGISSSVQAALEEQASLFAATDTRLTYADGQLVLTVSVRPKELGAEETLSLSANGFSAPMAAGADGSYTATLSLPLAGEVDPVVTFLSAAGTRQVELGPLGTSSVLTVRGSSVLDWGDDNDTVWIYVGLTPDSAGAVAGAEDVASLTLQVIDNGAAAQGGALLGTVPLTLSAPPAEDAPLADPEAAKDALLWYAADVSGYTRGKTCNLSFRAEPTTAGGLVLTDTNMTASFQKTGVNSGGNYGDFSLSPDWAE